MKYKTGMGRTGQMLCCDHENVKPDILILGKALSGGIVPLSAVLADSDVMDVITPGTHGSTFGGNPLASAVGIAAINVTINENLSKNSLELGEYFRNSLQDITKNNHYVVDIRGKGLMNGMELANKYVTDDLIVLLRNKGILIKSTHDNTIRLAPPLVIDKSEINKALNIIDDCLKYID